MPTNARIVDLMNLIEQSPENILKEIIVPIVNHPIDPGVPAITTALLEEFEDQRPYRWMIVLTEPRVRESEDPHIKELLCILRTTMKRGVDLARVDYKKRYPKLGKRRRGKSCSSLMIKNPKNFQDMLKLLIEQDRHGDTFREYKANGKLVRREVAFALTSFAESKINISMAQSIDDARTAYHRLLTMLRGWCTVFTTEAIHWGLLQCPATAVMHSAYYETGTYNPRDFGPIIYRSTGKRIRDLPDSVPKQRFMDALEIDFKLNPPADLSLNQLKGLLVKVRTKQIWFRS